MTHLNTFLLYIHLQIYKKISNASHLIINLLLSLHKIGCALTTEFIFFVIGFYSLCIR